MKKIILFAIFLICACVVNAQNPTGVPQLFNGKWYKFNQFVGIDSALLVGSKDTNWIPRQPSLVFWQHIGYDTAFWYHNGTRWNRIGGYIDTVYWNNKINSKQNLITLTTTGTTGPSTLIGSTLNIPNYGSALTGYVPYVGATANVDLGAYQLNANSLKSDFLMQIKNTPYSITPTSDYTSITPDKSGFVFYTSWMQGSTTYTQSNRFMYANPSLQNNTRQYNLPVRNGTLALLEDQIDTTSLSNRINLKADKATTLTINGVTYDLSANRTWTIPGTDTTSLSNRINLKLNISDTASMLSPYQIAINARVKYTDTASMLAPYLRKLDTASLSNRINLKADKATTLTINGTTYDLSANRSWTIPTTDTTSLSNRINAKLNISDTASMLSPYQIAINARVKYTDTASMLSPYLRKLDTASLSNRINLKQNILSLTTTGTSGAATLVGATLNIPQYQSVLTNPITGTGTINTVAKFTSSSAIGNSNIKDDGNAVSVNTTAGSFGALQVGNYNGNILMNTNNTNGGLIFQNTSSSNKLWDISSYNNDLNINESNISPSVMTLKSGGNVLISNLSGSGTRMVVASSTGVLSTQAISTTDTTSLSNRINTKLNISDTAAMLSPYLKSAVNSVTATSPITSTGGNNPIISTSMSTNKMIGRSTAGTGVMEQIGVGSGLQLLSGVLSATGAVTPTGYYGAFEDTTIQTVSAINTPIAMKLGVTDLSNQVTVVTDGSNLTRITIANTGIYNIQFSAQFDRTNSGTDVIDIWLRKNGVDIPGSGGKLVLSGGAISSAIIASWNYLLDVTAGDYYQMMFSSPDNHVRLLYETAQTTPFTHPLIPSLILTVTQQSGIMAGTGITAINSLTGSAQTMVTGTDSSDFKIVSTGTQHKFNLPTASSTKRGALSSADWSTFNGKMNYSDTTSLSNRINTKLNISDTASMLSNYQSGINARLKISDTASMLSVYLRKADTSSLSNRINTKQGTITLTTTGTSGAATFSSNTLNIPQYQAAGTYVTSVTGTSPIVSSGGTTPAISIPAATSSVNGYLSSTDWSTFNNKGSGSVTSVATGLGLSGGTITTSGTLLVDTASASILSRQRAANTYYLASNPNGYNTGTVTSVATGLGLSGGTISTSGTLLVDTSSASILSRQRAANTYQTILSNPTTGTGTANYHAKFTGSTTLGNSLIWDNGTNVGIGNTNTGYTFDVTGTARFTGKITSTLGNNQMYFQNNTATTGYIYQDIKNTSGELLMGVEGTAAGSLLTNGTAYATVLTSATATNLEFGTNQVKRFSLDGSTGAATFSSSVTTGSAGLTIGTSNYAGNEIQIGNGSTDFAIDLAGSGKTDIYSSSSLVFNTALAPRMTITSGGNVGIGTASPSALLHLSQNTTNLNLYLQNTNGSGQTWSLNSDYQGKFNIHNTSVNVFTISGTNVGIGTTSPSQPFHVYASSTTTSSFFETNSTNSYIGLKSTSGICYVGNVGYNMTFEAGGVERMRITSGGEVQINGTTSASGASKLTVRYDGTSNYPITVGNESVSGGLIRFAGNGSGVLGSITHNGTNVAYNTSSDYRLKEDFKEFNGLELISKIKTYDYAWKSNKSRMYGFIAHELQDILPYTVNGKKDEVDEDGNAIYQGVDYSKLTPILIKAVQELSAKNEALIKRIETLENK